jgi:hypothetical protein
MLSATFILEDVFRAAEEVCSRAPRSWLTKAVRFSMSATFVAAAHHRALRQTNVAFL